jgi:hypothetical protein
MVALHKRVNHPDPGDDVPVLTVRMEDYGGPGFNITVLRIFNFVVVADACWHRKRKCHRLLDRPRFLFVFVFSFGLVLVIVPLYFVDFRSTTYFFLWPSKGVASLTYYPRGWWVGALGRGSTLVLGRTVN